MRARSQTIRVCTALSPVGDDRSFGKLQSSRSARQRVVHPSTLDISRSNKKKGLESGRAILWSLALALAGGIHSAGRGAAWNAQHGAAGRRSRPDVMLPAGSGWGRGERRGQLW